jgi:hypothetical protein
MLGLIISNRGMGDIGPSGLVVDSGSGPVFNSSGQYQGGSPLTDFFCNSVLGSWLGMCSIPTPAQITAAQTNELAQTSLTPANQQIAINAGNQNVIMDASSNPGGYEAQIAAANHPTMSSIFGTGVTSILYPVDVTDPNNPVSTFPWMLTIIVGGIIFVVANVINARR